MQTCIQTTVVPKKERDYDNTVLSLRLTSAEAVRYWKLLDIAKERNPYAGKSDVVRELLGLAKPDLLKASDIEAFRGADAKKKVPMIEIKDTPKPKRKTG